MSRLQFPKITPILSPICIKFYLKLCHKFKWESKCTLGCLVSCDESSINPDTTTRTHRTNSKRFMGFWKKRQNIRETPGGKVETKMSKEKGRCFSWQVLVQSNRSIRQFREPLCSRQVYVQCTVSLRNIGFRYLRKCSILSKGSSTYTI